jgi:hypothetical protein
MISQHIPLEIWSLIAEKIKPADFIRLTQTNRFLHQLQESPVIWDNYFKNDFGYFPEERSKRFYSEHFIKVINFKKNKKRIVRVELAIFPHKIPSVFSSMKDKLVIASETIFDVIFKSESFMPYEYTSRKILSSRTHLITKEEETLAIFDEKRTVFSEVIQSASPIKTSGGRVVFLSYDKTLQVWDIMPLRRIFDSKCPPLYKAKLCRNRLLVLSKLAELTLWNIETGQEMGKWASVAKIFMLNPFFAVWQDGKEEISFWDLNKGSHEKTLPFRKNDLKAPRNNKLVFGGNSFANIQGGLVDIFNYQGVLLAQLNEKKGPIREIKIIRNILLVIYENCNSVTFWDLDKKQVVLSKYSGSKFLSFIGQDYNLFALFRIRKGIVKDSKEVLIFDINTLSCIRKISTETHHKLKFTEGKLIEYFPERDRCLFAVHDYNRPE